MKERTFPPALAKRFFEWYCDTALVEDLIGDMDELYAANIKEMPRWKANLKYWRGVLSFVFSYAITRRKFAAALHPYSQTANLSMIRNYFKIAGRTMIKNKAYTLINIMGLTFGISACLVVYLIVNYEFSFDKFHEDSDRIYRLNTIQQNNDGEFRCICVPAPAFTTLRDELEGTEAITGYHHFDGKVTITANKEEKRFDRNSGNIIITDPGYFKIFQYKWVAGDRQSFAKPFQVVLTEKRARDYFGNLPLHEIIGQQITYNDSLQVGVAGIVKTWDQNTDFSFTEFISFSTIENSFLRTQISLDSWGRMMHSSQSFIKIKSGDNPDTVALQIAAIISKRSNEQMNFNLQPLGDIHFNNNDEQQSTLLSTLYTYAGLAAFILIIACINFINLSTAQSIRRMREIGIRKVMGSLKKQIVFQFLSETLLITFLAICLGLLLLRPLLSLFDSFVPSGVNPNPFQWSNGLFLGGLLLFVSVVAGIYPALVLSSYQPADTLSCRSVRMGNQKWSLRKSLIVFQFAMSLFFITATLVIGDQLNFIQTSDRGFSTESVLTLRTNWRDKVSTVKALANRLTRVRGVEDVTVQSVSPMGFAQMTFTMIYNGKQGEIKLPVSVKSGDEHFISLYKIRLKEGRIPLSGDSVKQVLINETLANKLGFHQLFDVIGEQVTMDGQSLTIVGVVENFHEQSFHQPIGPVVIGNFEAFQHSIAVKLTNEGLLNLSQVINDIEHEFKTLYPDETFDYHFLEDEIGWMHGSEKQTGKLATIAMATAIFISCIGIFGLAMFTSEMRTKEIGVRKVLGATALNISAMLSREFVMLIGIAILLAFPIAWYVMNSWLAEFAFHVPLSAWIFVLAGLLTILVGLLTVSFQSLKTALANPLMSLKSE